MNTGLFFGSTTANSERIAEIIWDALYDYGCDIHDIRSESNMEDYDKLILVIPTWDFGEWQEDWENILPKIEKINWTNKTVAIIGLGDQIGYGEYYQDCMGMLYDIITPLGANTIGHTDTEGYSFLESKAIRNNKFVGLAIDEDSQPELTMDRIKNWLEINTRHFREKNGS
tara:strand:- start:409 stop:921 length:513 start_codon:yes stop_codon:yes gene_type:complete